MSNELSVLDIGLPAYLQELGLDDATKALMGSGPAVKRISIEGGVWRMLVNGKEVAKNEDRAMNVVIVAAAAKISRAYYAGTYKKGVASAPECVSADGEAPDKAVKNPQAQRCIDCPQNQKGSGQGDTRACRYNQRIAVVLANDIRGDVFQLQLPATSIFGEGEPGKWPLQTYARMVNSKGIPVTAVVTEMRFDTSSSTPKVTFKPMRVLDKEEHLAVIEQGKSDVAVKAITLTVYEVDTASKKAASESTSESKPETEAETTEPTVRSGKKEEEAAPAKDITKIIEDWDD